ncbi:MAG: hypothetical protein NTY35_05655 [Planctomycetota bacterium]|nr:hypothetical protein [Planctomycetota bacterium]
MPAVLAAMASLSVMASAQGTDPASQPEAKPTVQEQMLLRGRNRAVLHPSDPLKVGGREQEGNEMRAGTTALQQGKTATAGVKGDDTYARAIAMVDGRAVYSRPPRRESLTASSTSRSAPEKASGASHGTSAGEDSPRPSSNMPWALGGLGAAALALFAWLFVRNRA